jgi:5-enolpyruvylshikimate-3-phosphate synthase
VAEVLELKAARAARGRVCLPGSKSISNRVLLLAALACGETEIHGLLDADDTQVMRNALELLGVSFSGTSVKGVGGTFPVKQAQLFLGNAGTAFRPLTAALALSGGEYRLSGVRRMHERPIGDLVEALRGIGARIDYAGLPGFPPLAIHPGQIELGRPVGVRGDVSSQFLTALLMALPLAGRESLIEVQGELISKPYVEITLNVMRRFGIEVRRTDWLRLAIPSGRYKSPGKIYVEGDASSASYFLAAGALGGGPVRVQGVGRDSIQGDVRFTEVLSHGPQSHAGRRHDGGRDGAFCQRTEHAAQPGELAGEGDRSPRGDGARAAQARRAGGRGARFLAHRPAPNPQAGCADRHLRRPPHGDELLAGGAGRRAGRHHGSRLRGENLPRVFRAVRGNHGLS